MIEIARRVRTGSARLAVRIESTRLVVQETVRASLRAWYLEAPAEAVRLARFPIHARILAGVFVAMVGAGYLSAILQLHESHALADGKPGLTRDDVVATFHGLPSRTRLVVQVEGPMREHLRSEAEAQALVAWAVAGAPRGQWEQVRSTFAHRCVCCHGKDGEKEDVPLVSYEDVVRHNKIEPLISKKRLIALTHTHVLGLTALFGLVGAVFCLTSYPSRAKIAVVLMPFAGMTLDFGGWWLARLDEHFCDAILLGGALTGAGLGLLVAGVLAEVAVFPWLARRLERA